MKQMYSRMYFGSFLLYSHHWDKFIYLLFSEYSTKCILPSTPTWAQFTLSYLLNLTWIHYKHLNLNLSRIVFTELSNFPSCLHYPWFLSHLKSNTDIVLPSWSLKRHLFSVPTAIVSRADPQVFSHTSLQCCSLNLSQRFLTQGLCTGYFFCLKYFPLETYMAKSLHFIQVFAQMLPFKPGPKHLFPITPDPSGLWKWSVTH